MSSTISITNRGDRRYTNFRKSKKAAPENSEAALTLFC
jgi:hypothetical protein